MSRYDLTDFEWRVRATVTEQVPWQAASPPATTSSPATSSLWCNSPQRGCGFEL